MKLCPKCKIEKKDVDFSKNTIKCKSCYKENYLNNKEKIIEKSKENYLNNKDKIKGKKKEWYLNNKEKIKENYLNNKDKIKENYLNNKDKIKGKKKEWYLNNKEKIRDKSKEYFKKNKDKIKDKSKEYYENNKDKIYKYNKNKYKTDPIFKLIKIIRNDFNIRLKLHKNEVTYNYLSDDIPEYIKYLEQHPNWNNNFNWDNLGKIWEIDHIIPVYYFKNILDEQEDDNIKEQLLKICWSKENLQPLWKTTEISKEYGFDIVGNRNKNKNIDFNNNESKFILDKINKIFN